MKKYFSGIVWGLWIILTLIYMALPFFSILGLFVPFGFFNGAFAIFQPLSILVGICGIALADFITKKINGGIILSILIGLISLFIITFFVDMVLWHQWCSLTVFRGADCNVLNKNF